MWALKHSVTLGLPPQSASDTHWRGCTLPCDAAMSVMAMGTACATAGTDSRKLTCDVSVASVARTVLV